MSTRLSSAAITFEASFDTAGATDEALTMDWIEAGDIVCYTNDICDKLFYDAETLDVPVHRAAGVTVNAFSTPWGEFVSATPALVFYRDNAQEYVVKRWDNLAVPVDELRSPGWRAGPTPSAAAARSSGERRHRGLGLHVHRRRRGRGRQLTFAIDQQVDNALGVLPHLHDRQLRPGERDRHPDRRRLPGPRPAVQRHRIGSPAFYTAQELDASDPDTITWQVDVAVDLANFGRPTARPRSPQHAS